MEGSHTRPLRTNKASGPPAEPEGRWVVPPSLLRPCASGRFVRVFGLDVKMIDVEHGTATQRRFDAFPVRIGRNAMNDVRLESGYVSQFHAVLQLDADRVYLMDLGSRNGTELPRLGHLASPNTFVDLAEGNYEFRIWDTLFQVRLIQLEDAPNSRRRGGVHDFAEEMTHTHQIANVGTLAEHLEQLEALYTTYRESWGRLFAEIQKRHGTFDTKTQAKYCEQIMVSLPLVALEPEFKRLAGIAPASSSKINVDVDVPSSEGSHQETVASEGLRHLANWYLPGAPPPRSVEDVLGFLQAIQDTLDVFFKCFVPLREGYKQFEVEMDIRRGRSETVPNRVETARSSPELARALLDWRATRGNEQRSIENSFAALMTHQVAILNGVMKGVKSLLSELSPENIEHEADSPGGRGRQGLQIGPFRFKQLWDLYVKRHGDLSAEDKHTYSLIFGSQFAEAYAQFAGAAAGAPTVEARAIDLKQFRTVPPAAPRKPDRSDR
jgi:type VI secretion system protein ImpI